MKHPLQILCVVLLTMVATAVVADPPPSPVVASKHCKAECKEQYREHALECLRQTGAERDDTQREAFNTCMEPHALHRSACIQECLP